MLDPRALANFILDIADNEGFVVSNLSLNKIAYFLHGSYLARYDKPLVDAKIEAWQYGPVFREIYHQFKENDNRPIKSRAKVLDLNTGLYKVCGYNLSRTEDDFLRSVARPYVRMRPSALVNLSHQRGGPWHNAWFHEDTVNPGMEITEQSIRNYFLQQVRH